METIVLLTWSLVYFAVGAGILWAVVRGAVISALRHHALWRADGSYEKELQRHMSINGE